MPWLKVMGLSDIFPPYSARKLLAVGSIRKILYGMPDPDNFDFEKFAVGGCCFEGDGTDPNFACRVCGWSGVRGDL